MFSNLAIKGLLILRSFLQLNKKNGFDFIPTRGAIWDLLYFCVDTDAVGGDQEFESQSLRRICVRHHRIIHSDRERLVHF